MRRTGYAMMLLVAGTLLAGCADRGGPDQGASAPPTPLESGTTSPAPADPAGLIGSWSVAEADEGEGAILRLASDGARLFDRCGVWLGSWRADPNGLFVVGLFGLSGPDGTEGCALESTPGWLSRASGFRSNGDGRILVDDQGDQTARLLPGATPTAGPNLAPSEVEPPVVTDEVRRSFAPAVELPATLLPATRAGLVDRWVPIGGRAPKAYVELGADGGWSGSDGCNGTSGRWVAGPAGALLATTGPSTLVGCASVPVGSWLGDAWRAGLDGDVLVLLDARGGEIGRLRRA
ncbi:hypothetical protein I0C86_39945 [Plantactinospora sp. S1510]|uniref:META domain-containing protein n=1 Tax=Plantactinospora alkalitolerans TaxID=2789879 RepID=A0ABS0H9B1_9ACTN|nr:hypothetical protein [Plantactinospora alkalitolerans]MBF9135052.1 hypothetical protein [Plantactinospora alkalitolerans]